MNKQEEDLYRIFSISGIDLSQDLVKSLLEIDREFCAIGNPGFLDAIYRYLVSSNYQKSFENKILKLQEDNSVKRMTEMTEAQFKKLYLGEWKSENEKP